MKTIKLYDGVRLEHGGETQILEHPADLWEVFGWDIEHDEKAKECSLLITRQLIGFGYCKTEDAKGREIYMELIPAKDTEEE